MTWGCYIAAATTPWGLEAFRVWTSEYRRAERIVEILLLLAARRLEEIEGE